MYNIKYILNNALATTLADGMPSSQESGPQSLASSQVPSDSCQTAIRVLDDTIYYCWCMGTDLKLVPVLQEAGGYITSNTITISRPWRITTKIRYGHLLQVPSGDRQDSLVSTVVTHVRYADGQPSCPQSRGSVRCCDGRPGRPKVMATGPPPGCYTTCCHAQLQNITTRNTQTLGF